MSEWPFVSIVVPAYNAAKTIEALLTSLLNLDFPDERYEIIIVDNDSTDNTCQIVENYPVKLVEETELQGPAAARNKGVERAKGEIIAFTDADCVADRCWLKTLLANHADPTIGGFAGDLKGREPAETKIEKIFGRRRSNSPFQIVKSADGAEQLVLTKRAPIEAGAYELTWVRLGLVNYYKKRPPIPLLNWAPTPNVAYRKDVFNKIGFFDVGLIRGEDVDFAWRMQLNTDYKFCATPEAIIYHRHPTTFTEALKHLYKGGIGKLFILDKYLGFDRGVRREVILESILNIMRISVLSTASLLYRCFRVISQRHLDPLYVDEAALNLLGGISHNLGRIQASLTWDRLKKYEYLE